MANPTEKKPRPKKRSAYIALFTIIGILIFFAGIGSGVLQHGWATVVCLRAPVAASKFMASYSYELPGDPTYGPSPFNEYYCTEDAAKRAGFHRL